MLTDTAACTNNARTAVMTWLRVLALAIAEKPKGGKLYSDGRESLV